MINVWVLPGEKTPLLYPPLIGIGSGDPVFRQTETGRAALEATLPDFLKREEGVCLHWVGETGDWDQFAEQARVRLYLDRCPRSPETAARLTERIHVPSHHLKEVLERQQTFRPGQIALLPPLPEDRPHPWTGAGKTARTAARRKRKWRGRRVILAVEEYCTPAEQVRLCRLLRRLRQRQVPPPHLAVRSLKTVLSGADLLAADAVFTGGEESLALAPFHLTAMAGGTPVVSTDAGDRGEWVLHGHSGLLLAEGDGEQEWTRYFYRLVRDSAFRRDLGINGRLLFESLRRKQTPDRGRAG